MKYKISIIKKKEKKQSFSLRLFVQFIIVVFSSSTLAENRDSIQPLIWSVAKEGKTSYIFGTAHYGLSFKKNLLCPSQIEEIIKTSDLVFLENYGRLSQEEYKIIFTGFKEDKEKILSQLTPKERAELANRKQIIKANILMTLLHFQIVYRGNESFKDLSLDSQAFFSSRGLDIEGKNYVDYFHSFVVEVFFSAVFSLHKGLDTEVKEIALQNSLPIRSLDNHLKILSDIKKIKNKLLSEKPSIEITRVDLEKNIKSYKQWESMIVKNLLGGLEQYKALTQLDSLDFGQGTAWQVVMLKNRNSRWLEKFKKASQNPKVEQIFLAGGANHFMGPYNMINMLKKEGFLVRHLFCSEGELKQKLLIAD